MTFEGFIGVCLVMLFLVDPILIFCTILDILTYKKLKKRVDKLESEVLNNEKEYR